MTFSEQARQLKEQNNLTLKDIAEKCSISESTASRYLSGAIVPSNDAARNMLEALGGGPTEEKTEGEEDMQTALTMIREVYEARIADMQANISDLKDRIIHEKREKWIFIVLLAMVIIFVFALFYVDLSNGSVGWFRH